MMKTSRREWLRPMIVLVAATAILSMITVRSAAAQNMKVDFAGVYHSLIADSEDGYAWPAGWGVSFGIGKDRLKAVGEISGHYGGEDAIHYTGQPYQIHTFQGGLEVSAKPTRIVTYARALIGSAYFTGPDGNFPMFIFTPEVGLKIMASQHVGVQAAIGFPVLWDDDGTRGWARFSIGVVYRK